MHRRLRCTTALQKCGQPLDPFGLLVPYWAASLPSGKPNLAAYIQPKEYWTGASGWYSAVYVSRWCER